jgi:hypothetical protein
MYVYGNKNPHFKRIGGYYSDQNNLILYEGNKE